MKHQITYTAMDGSIYFEDYTNLSCAYSVYKLLCKSLNDVMLTTHIDTDNGKINTFQLMHVRDGSTSYIASVSSKWNGNICSHMDTRL